MQAQPIWELLKTTFDEWNEDKAPRLAAALAYHTLFSLAPLLVIAIAIAGLAFGREAVEGQLFGQIRSFVGDVGAAAIQDMIRGASNFSSGIIASVLGVGALLLGAAGFFGQLQDALNTIWEVQPKPGLGIGETIRQRFFSFAMVVGTGFLLLVSLVVSTALAAVVGYFQTLMPGIELLWQILNFMVAFAITTVLFALIFKVVPDVKIAWGDVWAGALATALLFSIGRQLLAIYLGQGSFGSTYGAAGSLVIVLLWVYYSAQILFLGAEFTQVYTRKYGSGIRPAPHAVAIDEQVRAQQGMVRSGGQQPQARAAAAAEPQPAGVLAVVGFLVGTLLGRRKRMR